MPKRREPSGREYRVGALRDIFRPLPNDEEPITPGPGLPPVAPPPPVLTGLSPLSVGQDIGQLFERLAAEIPEIRGLGVETIVPGITSALIRSVSDGNLAGGFHSLRSPDRAFIENMLEGITNTRDKVIGLHPASEEGIQGKGGFNAAPLLLHELSHHRHDPNLRGEDEARDVQATAQETFIGQPKIFGPRRRSQIK